MASREETFTAKILINDSEATSKLQKMEQQLEAVKKRRDEALRVSVEDNCFIPCFYIKPQLARRKELSRRYCFIPCFYIKPQLPHSPRGLCFDCFIPCFYIKPQLAEARDDSHLDCFIPCFYIKPQLYFCKAIA